MAEVEGKPIEVVAGVVVERGRVLIAQRREDQTFPLQWEFPGGKQEVGESVEAALDREFREELGVGVTVLGPYGEICYRNPLGHLVRVSFYRARKEPEEPEPLQVAAIQWAPLDRLDDVAFIPHNRVIVDRLGRELHEVGEEE